MNLKNMKEKLIPDNYKNRFSKKSMKKRKRVKKNTKKASGRSNSPRRNNSCKMSKNTNFGDIILKILS